MAQVPVLLRQLQGGPLAQRLVQQTHNLLVVGSNPTGPTICDLTLAVPSVTPNSTVGLNRLPLRSDPAARIPHNHRLAWESDRHHHSRFRHAQLLGGAVTQIIETIHESRFYASSDAVNGEHRKRTQESRRWLLHCHKGQSRQVHAFAVPTTCPHEIPMPRHGEDAKHK